ncbi:hypothetical protein SUGI_0130510 [Cryptomeria japonica]|nr:hypothetical protein SUGI_0130510 [Cryptomeria japonica]
MREVGLIYWDEKKLRCVIDFSYEGELEFSFSPDGSSLWKPSEFCTIEEIAMHSNERQNDVMDFAPELVEVLLEWLKEMAQYLSQSLQQTQIDKRPLNSISNGFSKANFLGAFILLNQAYPLIKNAHFSANQSILKAMPSTKQQSVYIIGFDIMDAMQWPSLMEALKNENYKIGHLKITAVEWVDSYVYSNPFLSCYKDTGKKCPSIQARWGFNFRSRKPK